ncbi:ester cyclase [Halobacteriales archaeon SW_12_69_24]|nr:MAG: ester cyclase [Halobacteriales archaeon SW_12_69_24]
MNQTDSAADPETLVHRWFDELFNRGDLPVADEILADDVSYDGPQSLSPGDVTGPEDVKAYVETYRTAFPDLFYTVEETTVTGGTVVVRWSAMGTHENDLLGIEPTGEGFAVDGLDVFTVVDGAITDVVAQWDTLKMVQELGVVSAMASTID